MKVLFLSAAVSFFTLIALPAFGDPPGGLSEGPDVSGGYVGIVEAAGAKAETNAQKQQKELTLQTALDIFHASLRSPVAIERSAATMTAFAPGVRRGSTDGAGLRLLERLVGNDYKDSDRIKIAVASVLARLARQIAWTDAARTKLVDKTFEVFGKISPKNKLAANLTPNYKRLTDTLAELRPILNQKQKDRLDAILNPGGRAHASGGNGGSGADTSKGVHTVPPSGGDDE